MISNFCDSKGDGQARKLVAAQLKAILTSLMESGTIMHYNNHYYAASLADDLEAFVDLNSEGDTISDKSSLSITSSDSIDECPPNFEDIEDIDEPNSREDSTSSSASSKKTDPQGKVPQAKEK
ncbi:hypothetical protein ACLKA7_003738 [Drosophila subpalustris]